MTHAIPAKPLVDALIECADLWCAAHQPDPAPLARLGRLAVGDGGFFTRLPTQSKGATTDTLERFARFLLDPANWPDGKVVQEAREFAHRLGVSLSVAGLATGQAADLSGGREPEGEAA